MPATDRGPWSVVWVDDIAQADQQLAEFADADLIALDTEFVRERTYFPRLALVQLAVPGRICLLDPLQPAVRERFSAFLAHSAALFVMHAAGEDMQALATACRALPGRLFDTQIAAALAGFEAAQGYQRLVAGLVDVQIDKGETRSDWMQRPLTEAQRTYAANDVRWLHALHDDLSTRLHDLGREAWLAEDCARMLNGAGDMEGDAWPHLALRSAQNMDIGGQWRLCRLLRWREAQARRSDRPRGWVLDNELAVALAAIESAARDRFDACLDAHAKAPRRLREDIWRALAEPLPVPEAFPLASVQTPAQRDTLRRWQTQVRDESARLQLAEGVLASRRVLQARLTTGQWPPDLTPWRRALLEPLIATQDVA